MGCKGVVCWYPHLRQIKRYRKGEIFPAAGNAAKLVKVNSILSSGAIGPGMVS
jgi:hypothetical protein